MKKLLLTLILSVMLLTSVFSLTIWEKLMLPEYMGDISKVDYKIIESSDDVWIVEIDGVTYIYKFDK